MKISIIGTGYVGLPTACAFAKWGHKVVCVDTNIEKISKLQQCKPTIYEKGLEELMDNVAENLTFTTDYKNIADSDFVVLAVGTPMDTDGSANLKYLYEAALSVDKNVKNSVIVVKSTVPVGTCAELNKYIANNKIASMPEFLREGYALEDIFNPDRIIIGTQDVSIYNLIKSAYPEEYQTKIHYIRTWESSELIKYASNAFLAIKLHYINEIANLCEKTRANVEDVAKGMGLDSRIGPKFLKAGCGYGGSCFPKDTNAIYALAESKGVDLSLVGATINGNRKRQRKIAYDINKTIQILKPAKIAVLGLAFKEGTDDVRESPAMNIVKNLKNLDNTQHFTVYDPMAMDNAKKELQNIEFAEDIENCIKGANILIIATEWDEFKNIYGKLDLMSDENIDNVAIPMFIYDLKNILNEDNIPPEYIYNRIGKGTQNDRK